MRVIDTSVVLAWYVAEEGSEAALPLLGTDLIAPNLLMTEMANALWKKWHRAEISEVQAFAILAEANTAVGLFAHEVYLERALALALTLDHPVYDCVFLAMAETMEIPFVTADRKFANVATRGGHGRSIELIA